MKSIFRLGNRFFDPANILAILLVLVNKLAYIIAKLIPGISLLKVHDMSAGFAKIGKTCKEKIGFIVI